MRNAIANATILVGVLLLLSVMGCGQEDAADTNQQAETSAEAAKIGECKRDKLKNTSVRSMGLVPQGCPKIGVQFLSVLASPGVADEVRAT